MGFKIDPGELKHKIIIQELTTIVTENKFEEEKWKKFVERWAKKTSLSGREFWSAKQNNSEDTIKFVVRYSKKLEVLFSKNAKLKYRIKHKDIVYNLVFANNIKEKNEWIEIKAVEENE